jgi:hypothetical protein
MRRTIKIIGRAKGNRNKPPPSTTHDDSYIYSTSGMILMIFVCTCIYADLRGTQNLYGISHHHQRGAWIIHQCAKKILIYYYKISMGIGSTVGKYIAIVVGLTFYFMAISTLLDIRRNTPLM